MDVLSSTVNLDQLRAICPVDYQITSLIATGGYGVVVKALDAKMQRTVAIKFLNPSFLVGRDPEAMKKKLQLEGIALARLDHPNIVQILQMGLSKNEQAFLVYEYLDGITLETLLAKKKRLSNETISSIFSQILSGLSHAHSMGVIHGDIKPANIMLIPKLSIEANSIADSDTNKTPFSKNDSTASPRAMAPANADSETEPTYLVKILDFGLARILEEEELTHTGLTATATLRGTPWYMSPEQCRGEKAKIKSDFYSLGCVLFECVTGAPPFSGETPIHVLYKHLNAAPEFHDDVPAPLKELLNASLSKDETKRPENTSQFRGLLDDALKERKDQAFKMPFRSSPKFAVLLSVGAVTLIAGTSLLLFNHQKSVIGIDATTPSNASNKLPKGSIAGQLIRCIKAYTQRGDKASAFELLQELEPIIKQTKDRKFLYIAYYFKANALALLNDYKAALEASVKSVEFSKGAKGEYSADSVLALYQSANLERIMQLPTAKEHALEARSVLDLVEREKLTALDLPEELSLLDIPAQSAEIFSLLSSMEESNLTLATNYAKKAMEISTAREGLVHGTTYVIKLAQIYDSHGNKPEALELITRLEKQARTLEFNDPVDVFVACLSVGEWHKARNKQKHALEIVKFGIALAKSKQRVTESAYTRLVDLKNQLESNPISIENKLATAWSEFDKAPLKNVYPEEAQKKFLAILDNEIIPRIKKPEQFYSAYFAKASCTSSTSPKDAIKFFEKALEYSRDKDGKLTIQSADCLSRLAKNSDACGDDAQTEQYALRSLKILEAGSQSIPRLNIPKNLDHVDIEHSMYLDYVALGTILEKRGDLNSACKRYREAKDLLWQSNLDFRGSRAVIKLARALELTGKKHLADSEIHALKTVLNEQLDDLFEPLTVGFGYTDLANWYSDHKQREDALNCYKSALKCYEMAKARSQLEDTKTAMRKLEDSR